MSSLVIEMPVISNLALDIMKRVIDENEKTHKINDEELGPRFPDMSDAYSSVLLDKMRRIKAGRISSRLFVYKE